RPLRRSAASPAHAPPLSLPLCPRRSRPPPRSTLFPYTTLFRSLDRDHLVGVPAAVVAAEAPHRARESSADEALLRVGVVQPAHLDRKSTRLNSSHVAISYAVFCLKKKKKNKSMLIETSTRQEKK